MSIDTKSFDNSLVIIRLDRSHMTQNIVKIHKLEAEKRQFECSFKVQFFEVLLKFQFAKYLKESYTVN